jgi:hypothetical protein
VNPLQHTGTRAWMQQTMNKPHRIWRKKGRILTKGSRRGGGGGGGEGGGGEVDGARGRRR